MKRIGIVGSEGAKFTAGSELDVRGRIHRLLVGSKATHVVSGKCHLGGIDIWAVEEGRRLGLGIIEHEPRVLHWSAPGGYKDRNLLIVRDSDGVVCFTVDRLPKGYDGMRFERCYHCGSTSHVKSGGCWTVKQAVRAGKPGRVIVVPQWGD